MPFHSELERARARDDLPVLEQALGAYFESFESKKALDPNTQTIIDRAGHDPSVGIALATLACAQYDHPGFLTFLAAGPVEDLLREPDKAIAERLASEARKFARLRWLLSGVWPHAIHEENRSIIASAVGSISLEKDPLPRRPETT